MNLEQLAGRLAHPQVRALAWLIGSPVLLDEGDPRFAGRLVGDAWCHAALAQAAPWLLDLDRDPQPLIDFLAARPTRRLGLLAESLIAFWLRSRPGLELLAQNLPVRSPARTLGEFDFIFREAGLSMATHWETAIKFYLFRPELGGLAGYVGPGAQDVLAAKVELVFGHQFILGASAEGVQALKALGVTQLQPHAWLKGWLFYPRGYAGPAAAGVSPRHARGWWLRLGHNWEDALSDGSRYAILPRLDWMTWPWVAPAEQTLERGTLVAAVEVRISAGGGALMVVELDATGAAAGRETSRGFVVPADW